MFENEKFKSFIEDDKNIKNYYTILNYVLLHPKKVLSILVRDQISSTQMKYKNVVLKNLEFHYLRSFFMSQLNNQYNMLTYFMNDAWNCNHSTWNNVQFEIFMNDILQSEVNEINIIANFYQLYRLNKNLCYFLKFFMR